MLKLHKDFAHDSRKPRTKRGSWNVWDCPHPYIQILVSFFESPSRSSLSPTLCIPAAESTSRLSFPASRDPFFSRGMSAPSHVSSTITTVICSLRHRRIMFHLFGVQNRVNVLGRSMVIRERYGIWIAIVYRRISLQHRPMHRLNFGLVRPVTASEPTPIVVQSEAWRGRRGPNNSQPYQIRSSNIMPKFQFTMWSLSRHGWKLIYPRTI